jgi:hypothetical protein
VVDWQFYIRLHSNRTEANIWSDLGMGAVAQWKAFDHYLTEVARGRSVLPGPSELELCLPYAAAFGLSPPLLKRQEKRDGYAQPAWFQAIPTADSSDSTSWLSCIVAKLPHPATVELVGRRAEHPAAERAARDKTELLTRRKHGPTNGAMAA